MVFLSQNNLRKQQTDAQTTDVRNKCGYSSKVTSPEMFGTFLNIYVAETECTEVTPYKFNYVWTDEYAVKPTVTSSQPS